MSKPVRTLAALAALLAVTSTLAADAPGRGESTPELVATRLQAPVTLQLSRTPLPVVLEMLQTQTGVPVTADESTWDLLPWDRQTPISVTINNAPLGESLDAIVATLGLETALADDSIRLLPSGPLQRIGRRATVAELSTLDRMRGFSVSQDPIEMSARDLLAYLDSSVAAMSTPDGAQAAEAQVVLKVLAPDVELDRVVRVPRNSSLLAALESLAEQTKLTWRVRDASVEVIEKRALNAERLEKTVSVRYDGTDVSQVLADLSTQSGLPFAIEPGAVQRVPPPFRTIRLYADATTRQTLESLAAFTGLGYVVTDEGVYLWNNSPTPATAPGASPRIVATVDAGNGIQVLIREDQLPPDIRAMLESRVRQAIDDLQQQATTQPTR